MLFCCVTQSCSRADGLPHLICPTQGGQRKAAMAYLVKYINEVFLLGPGAEACWAWIGKTGGRNVLGKAKRARVLAMLATELEFGGLR